MNGLLLQPGRDKGLCSPGSHHVTGWAAISFSSRAASSSRVSPIKPAYSPSACDEVACFFNDAHQSTPALIALIALSKQLDQYRSLTALPRMQDKWLCRVSPRRLSKASRG